MFFHFQCSSFQGLLSASLEGRISSCIFLRLRFSVLLLLCIFFSLHAFTSSLLAHSRHAHTPLVHSLAHARWTLALPTAAGGRGGGRRPIEGLWLEEMNLAPQHWVQTFIHNGSIHTHVWWRGRLGDGRTSGAPSGRRTAELSYGSSYACFVGFPFVFLWFVASISWFWCIWFSRADTAFLLSL